MTVLYSHLPFFKSKNLDLNVQVSLLEKLSKLLDNGYTIIQALSVMEWDEKIAEVCRTIAANLKDGLPIDEAFRKAHFAEEVTVYLYFARSSGNLTSVLNQCSDMMKNRVASRKKFKQTTRYPTFLLFIGVILLWFVKQSVYPAFYDLFSSSGNVSPILTYSILAIDLLFLFFQVLLILLLMGIPGSILLKHFTSIEFQIKFYRKIPIYRIYMKKRITFLFSLHLSTLFHAGFSQKEAFQTIAIQHNPPILSYYANHILEELEYGVPLRTIFPTLYFLETELQTIFQKNASISWIEKDLSTYASFLIEQMQEQIKKVAMIIQPAVFCLLGLLIVFIYLSIMLPMFQLINSI